MSNTINVQKECLQVEAERETQIGHDPSEIHWNRTWIDETSDLLFNRGIEINHNGKDSKKMSQNKTIVEHALHNAEQTHQKRNILKQIDFVQLKKRMCIPYEMMGNNGRSPTDCWRDIDMSSQSEWRFLRIKNERINFKQRRT